MTMAKMLKYFMMLVVFFCSVKKKRLKISCSDQIVLIRGRDPVFILPNAGC